jgi:hypothetical protein
MPLYYTAMWNGFMLDEWAASLSTVMELLKKNCTSWSLATLLESLYASLSICTNLVATIKIALD